MITMETLKGVVNGVLDDLKAARSVEDRLGKETRAERAYRLGQISMLEWVLKEMDHD